MIDLELIIQAKSTEKELWKKTLEFSRHTLSQKALDDRSFSLIAKESSTPEQFTLISKMLYQHGKTHPQAESAILQLFQNVDSSKFSLAEWIEAIYVFYEWLKNEKRSTSFTTMLGYLQCCGDSPENKDIKRSFPQLVQEMLETYGYDG